MFDAVSIGCKEIGVNFCTTLWVGGAEVSADKYLAYQRGWRNNRMVSEYLRRELPLDPEPALHVDS